MSHLFYSTALRSENFIKAVYRNLKNNAQYITAGQPVLEFIPLNNP